MCTADCNYSTSQGCGSGLYCSVTGSCVPVSDAAVPDHDGEVLTDGSCPNIALNTNRITPNIILLVDRSGSMTETFVRRMSRWDVLRNTLLDTPGGLIRTYEDRVRFGFAMYTGNAPTMCPEVDTYVPAVGNYDTISAAYTAAEPADDTPTGPSIDALLADPAMVHATSDPTIIVVATDGEPDECETGNDTVVGKMIAVEAAARSHAAGVDVYMLAVGNAIDGAHLTDMANAGVGHTTGPDAPYWLVNDDTGLRAAFDEIIGGQVSCTVSLTNGSINSSDPAQYCAADVRINGNPVACNDANGWHAADSTHIEFTGTSCDLIMNMGATVSAVFPCDQATLF